MKEIFWCYLIIHITYVKLPIIKGRLHLTIQCKLCLFPITLRIPLVLNTGSSVKWSALAWEQKIVQANPSIKPNRAKSWQWCDMLSLHLFLVPCRCLRVDWIGYRWTCKLTYCGELWKGDEGSSRHYWKKVVPALSYAVGLLPNKSFF